MDSAALLATLDALPRLGWVGAPSPVDSLPSLAAELDLAWLGVKRDDRLTRLHGGSKVRKLDFLLAEAPFARAPRWASVGAIGSGHLVALAAAAAALERSLDAHLFWEPPDRGVLDNLAFIASGPTRLSYTHGRVGLALRHPALLVGHTWRGAAVIAPGGSTGAGMAGTVRGGLELAVQVAAGALPCPDRLYVPLGSGGTAVGLALGVALGGLPTVVHAVSATERIFTTRRRLMGLQREAVRWLRAHGIDVPPACRALPAQVHGFVGRAYGVATEASRAAVERLAAARIALEPIYSGKAMAALLAARHPGERVLFWLTPRDAAPLPHDDAWQERLPAALRRRLAGGRGPTRRRLILAGGAALIGGGAALRLSGYPDAPGGARLAPWAMAVIEAASEALLPPAPAAPPGEVARNVDAYLVTFPPDLVREVKGMLAVVEHGPALRLELHRFTALPLERRRAWLESLAAAGGLKAQIHRGLRDLCMLGYYQRPEAWPALSYGGPWVGGEARPDPYARLAAPPGAAPAGWQP